MIHTKSESDITSLAPSSPSSSPPPPPPPPTTTTTKTTTTRAIYYVQSPSRDSSLNNNNNNDDYANKSASTPMYTSPMESPSHPSLGRHSRNSSASRFSGIFRSSSGRKGSSGRRRSNNNEKGWPECNVILEEAGYGDNHHKGLSRRMQCFVGFLSFLVLFTVFCFIIWAATRPFKTQLTLKSLAVNNLYVAEATDFSGVPTRVITINATLKIGIYNPATFFGIHVTSTPVSLLYSRIVVATGELQKHYQRRKSRSTIPITLIGDKVPLYGAGQSLEVSNVNGGLVPFFLDMEIRSRGDVVGKLVSAKHRLHIFCNVTVDYLSTKPIKFKKDSCTS
ncbi:hypothetical protein vseg_007233 [Gypsophila vaccaria]